MIDIKIKQMFFDSDVVVRALDKANRTALIRAGAFVRKTAKQSIRKRKRASLPGHPPSSHKGQLKRFIFFGYDTSRQSVFVGPVKLGRSKAPQVLEHSGTTVVRSRSRRSRSSRRVVKIAARPFMAPALEKNRAELPKLWANSIK